MSGGGGAMCSVVVTSRVVLWTLLTLATTLALVAAVITPTWLVGPPRRLRGRPHEDLFTPSLGLYNGCLQVSAIEQLFTEHCAPFVSSFSQPSDDFPTFWKAALVLLNCGLGLLVAALLAALAASCCSCPSTRKALFTVAGTVQAIAGLLFVVALTLYPAGWGSRRIQTVCGSKVAPYNLGDCSIGWTYYLAMVGTAVTFLCALLSIQAEGSTSSSRVQSKLNRGRSLICIM